MLVVLADGPGFPVDLLGELEERPGPLVATEQAHGLVGPAVPHVRPRVHRGSRFPDPPQLRHRDVPDGLVLLVGDQHDRVQGNGQFHVLHAVVRARRAEVHGVLGARDGGRGVVDVRFTRAELLEPVVAALGRDLRVRARFPHGHRFSPASRSVLAALPSAVSSARSSHGPPARCSRTAPRTNAPTTRQSTRASWSNVTNLSISRCWASRSWDVSRHCRRRSSSSRSRATRSSASAISCSSSRSSVEVGGCSGFMRSLSSALDVARDQKTQKTEVSRIITPGMATNTPSTQITTWRRVRAGRTSSRSAGRSPGPAGCTCRARTPWKSRAGTVPGYRPRPGRPAWR